MSCIPNINLGKKVVEAPYVGKHVHTAELKKADEKWMDELIHQQIAAGFVEPYRPRHKKEVPMGFGKTAEKPPWCFGDASENWLQLNDKQRNDLIEASRFNPDEWVQTPGNPNAEMMYDVPEGQVRFWEHEKAFLLWKELSPSLPNDYIKTRRLTRRELKLLLGHEPKTWRGCK